jgi:hypothetical protein
METFRMLTYAPELNRKPVFLPASPNVRCILASYGRLTVNEANEWKQRARIFGMVCR